MTRSYPIFLLLLFLLSACFLRKDFKTAQFAYNSNGQVSTLPLLVPKGYTRQERVDTAGIALQTFYYPGGPILYVAYLKDTSLQLQTINEQLHQSRLLLSGGKVFKGVDENELFYREVRQGNLRVGYRFVPTSVELLFDSATNYVVLQGR